MAKVLDSKIPAGPVPEKWKEYKAHQRPQEQAEVGCYRGWYWFGWCFCSCFTR